MHHRLLATAALLLAACSPDVELVLGRIPGRDPGATSSAGPCGPIPLALAITFEGGVDEPTTEAWRSRVCAASELLWSWTEGQCHIGACRIEDGVWGEIVIPATAITADVLPDGAAFQTTGPGSSHWRMIAAGRPTAADDEVGLALARALAHAVFALPAAPPTDACPECSHCVLSGDHDDLCGGDECAHGVLSSCRQRLSDRYYGLLRLPNPGWTDGPAPPVDFEPVESDTSL